MGRFVASELSIHRPLTPALRLGLMAQWVLVFAAVYCGSSWLTSHYPSGVKLFFDWERAIPMVPAMAYPYWSILLALALPFFVLDDLRLARLGRAFVTVTCFAGLSYVLLNPQFGFSRPATIAPEDWALALVFLLDPPRNCLPSLHVTYAVLVLRVLTAGGRPMWICVAAAGWCAMVALSTLLIHQHHVLDVVCGAAVGLVAARWVCRRSVVRPGGRREQEIAGL